MLEKMKLALNIVTDVSLNYAVKVSAEALKAGAESIWIGETRNLPHPFKYLSHIGDHVKAHLGTSIISAYLNPVDYVVKFSSEIFAKTSKFTLGIGLGDIDYLKSRGIVVDKPLKFMENYVGRLLKKIGSKISVVIGTAGKKMANLSCRLCGAVMLNLVFPEYIRYIKRNIDYPCEITVIGPSLIINNNADEKLVRALRIASAIVLKGMNRQFLKEFGLSNIASEVRLALIQGDYWKLRKYDKLFFERFSFYGNLDGIEETIRELLKLNVKRVIFGPPLYRRIQLVRETFLYLSFFK